MAWKSKKVGRIWHHVAGKLETMVLSFVINGSFWGRPMGGLQLGKDFWRGEIFG